MKEGQSRTCKLVCAALLASLASSDTQTFDEILTTDCKELARKARNEVKARPIDEKRKWLNPDVEEATTGCIVRKSQVAFPRHLNGVPLTPTSLLGENYCLDFQHNRCKEEDNCRHGLHKCAAVYKNGRTCHMKHAGSLCWNTHKHKKLEDHRIPVSFRVQSPAQKKIKLTKLRSRKASSDEPLSETMPLGEDPNPAGNPGQSSAPSSSTTAAAIPANQVQEKHRQRTAAPEPKDVDSSSSSYDSSSYTTGSGGSGFVQTQPPKHKGSKAVVEERPPSSSMTRSAGRVIHPTPEAKLAAAIIATTKVQETARASVKVAVEAEKAARVEVRAAAKAKPAAEARIQATLRQVPAVEVKSKAVESKPLVVKTEPCNDQPSPSAGTARHERRGNRPNPSTDLAAAVKATAEAQKIAHARTRVAASLEADADRHAKAAVAAKSAADATKSATKANSAAVVADANIRCEEVMAEVEADKAVKLMAKSTTRTRDTTAVRARASSEPPCQGGQGTAKDCKDDDDRNQGLRHPPPRQEINVLNQINHRTEAECVKAFLYTDTNCTAEEIRRLRAKDQWTPPPVHKGTLKGTPTLWQSKSAQEAKTYVTLSKPNKSRYFWGVPQFEKLDIQDIYSHLRLRRFDKDNCETIADQLGEPVYKGQGWWSAKIKMTSKEAAEYEPGEDNPDSETWMRAWQGTKLYCVPGIIRQGLRASEDKTRGDQFFDGMTGVCSHKDKNAHLANSYMICTSLPGRRGQFWKFRFEVVQKTHSTRVHKTGQCVIPRDEVKLKYLWMHGSNLDTASTYDWAYLTWEPSWEAPEEYSRASGHSGITDAPNEPGANRPPGSPVEHSPTRSVSDSEADYKEQRTPGPVYQEMQRQAKTKQRSRAPSNEPAITPTYPRQEQPSSSTASSSASVFANPSDINRYVPNPTMQRQPYDNY